MARPLPEWIGKTPDSAIPDRVRRRVFDAWGGRCHVSGREIDPLRDEYEIDHVIALCNGGENRESNLAPILIEIHKIKTRANRREKDKVERVRRKHLGLHRPKTRPMPCGRNSPWKKPVGSFRPVPRHEVAS